MRLLVTSVMVLSIIFSATIPAQAAEAENNAMTKLGRGILNILDAVTEIPGTVMRESSADGVATGVTAGTVKGIVNTVVRGLVGVYEVATFPIPVPEGYAPILDDPKFLQSE